MLASAESEAEAYPALLAAIGTELGLRRRAVAARRRRRAALRPGVADGRRGGGRARARRVGARAPRRPLRPARRVRLPAPRRRRHGLLDRRAARARREPAGHDGQPRLADLAVRRALPGPDRPARERRAQERDPERRVRLHHHDGPPRQRGRGQPRGGAHVRLPRRGDDRARTGRADRAAELARRRIAAGLAALRANRPRRVRRPPGRGAGHARGRQRVPGRADRHPRRPPRPAAVLRLPARRDRDARARARPAPARDRAGGAAARGHRGRHRAPTRGTRSPSSPRRSGGCSARRARTWSASTTTLHATVVGAWNEGDVRNVPVGDTVRMDGDTASARVFRTGAPARVDSYADSGGELPRGCASSGFTSRGRGADLPQRAAVGRGDRLQRRAASRSRPAPSSGSRTSPSSPRRRWPTRRRAPISRHRARASCRPATPSGGGWSATCTTARSSGSSRWR